MLRVEGIPYNNLDERYELSRSLENQRKQKKLKKVTDIGGCFVIEHFEANNNLRI